MMVAGLKYLHLAAMLCWCASLVALPLLLHFYGQIWRGKADSSQTQARYAEFRLITHFGYVGFATPAAVIAIAAGLVAGSASAARQGAMVGAGWRVSRTVQPTSRSRRITVSRP